MLHQTLRRSNFFQTYHTYLNTSVRFGNGAVVSACKSATIRIAPSCQIRGNPSPPSESSGVAGPKIYDVVKAVTSGPVDYSNKARDDNLLWHKCLLSSLYILLRKPLLYSGATIVKKWSAPSEWLYERPSDNGGLLCLIYAR